MKKIISVILVAVMAISVVGVVLAKDKIADSDNNDNKISGTPLAPPSEWAEESVAKAKDVGILKDDVIYRYRMSITREEFCELIYNYCDILGKTMDSGVAVFEDTDNVKVHTLNVMGIINGKSESEFAPKDFLTREEAATILFRLIDKVHPNWVAHEIYYEFKDSAEISDWAMDSIQRVCNMGIMNGVDNGNFAPKSNFTTEQAIVTVVRVYDGFNREETNVDNLGFSDALNLYMPENENYMISPLSIKMALALAANGAEGETKQEILSAVGITDLDVYNNDAKSMIDKYSQTDLLKLDISNSIWINIDNTPQSFSKDYSDKTEKYLYAESGTVTNKNALDKINGWVDEKTNGKISEIISEQNKDFDAMLVNAVYFKGRWEKEFSKAATEKDVFTDRNGKESHMDFMNKTADLKYADANGIQIIELPYLTDEKSGDMDVSMYLMMSDEEFNPIAVLDAAELSKQYVALSVPKFKIEYDIGLVEILRGIGIRKAFGGSAEFEKMFDSGNMYISDALHKTYIQVDEEGTEAAAVTAFSMKATSARPTPKPEPIVVKFNKPFTFVVKDNTNGEILFMGEYAFSE